MVPFSGHWQCSLLKIYQTVESQKNNSAGACGESASRLTSRSHWLRKQGAQYRTVDAHGNTEADLLCAVTFT
jgi:hypothetical protein